jgi:hypothetical protein
MPPITPRLVYSPAYNIGLLAARGETPFIHWNP